MKKACEVLFFALIAFAFTGNAFGADLTISNCADLKTFARNVNNGEQINSKYYAAMSVELTGNIDCSNTSDMESIGNSTDANKYFTGTFEGNGYTISGYLVKGSKYKGIFGFSKGTIQNLVVVGAKITSNSDLFSDDYGGTIVGYNAGTVFHCTVVNGSVDAKRNAGGIAGYNTGTISECLCSATVNGNGWDFGGQVYVGGICGYSSGIVTNSVYNGSSITRNTLGAASTGETAITTNGSGTVSKCYYDSGKNLSSSVKAGGGIPTTNVNSDSVVCKLNNGTWDETNKKCSDSDANDDYWSKSSNITNNGVVVSSGEIKYRIDFDANGGTLTGSVTYKEFELGDLLDTSGVGIPVNSNKFFAGWASSKTASEPEVLGTVSRGLTYYAVWKGPFVVTFNMNGHGSAISSKTVRYNEKVAKPSPNPTAEGHTFEGWFENAQCSGSEFNFATPITADKTLYARWSTDVYTITYNPNKGTNNSANPKTYNYDTPTITLQNPTRDYYTFEGWYANSDFSGSKVTQIANHSTGNKVLYAKWKAVSYSISYELNGGSNNALNPSSYTTETETVTLQGATKNYYTFNNWFDNAQFTGNAVTQIAKGSNGDKTLYAKWTATSYNINFSLNGGDELVNAPENYTVESATITLPTPSREGYKFEGWYNNAQFTGSAVTQIANGSNGEKSFFAKWSMVVNVTAYEGTYDGNFHNITVTGPSGATVAYSNSQDEEYSSDYEGVSGIGSYTVYYKVTQTGYDDVEGSSTVNIAPVINLNLGGATLVCTAGEPGAANCGSSNTIKHKYGSEDTELPAARLNGYEFQGWFADAAFEGNAVTSIPGDQSEEFVIYPKFVKTITAKFDDKSVDVEVYSTDNAESIAAKVKAAVESESIDVSKQDEKYNYALDKFVCSGSGTEYNCDIVYTKTGRDFVVKTNLPAGATLDCTSEPGASSCAEGGQGIKHQYDVETTSLPNASLDGWEFAGWFERENGEGAKVESIGKEKFGDDINIYPYFTRTIVVSFDNDEVDPINVVIDLDDDEEDINEKVTEEASEQGISDPEKESEEGETVFIGYKCEEGETQYNCEPDFGIKGFEYPVTVNLPEGATLVCDLGADGAGYCDENGNLHHHFGEETTPLPAASFVGWDFQGWFNNKDGIHDGSDGPNMLVTSIEENAHDDIVIYPYFTRNLEISLSNVPGGILSVEIDHNDNADSVTAKMNEAYNKSGHSGNPEHEPSEMYDYTFKGYVCKNSDSDFACEAAFDSTGKKFDVAVNLINDAKLVCTEGAFGAANCNEDGNGIVHQYGVETKPLPDAAVYKGSEVDESWVFQGWFDNKDGVSDGSLEGGLGKKINSIGAEEYGENINIYPYFTQNIKAILPTIPEVALEFTVDYDDTDEEKSEKMQKAFNALDPRPENPTKESDEKYDYDFAGYSCEGLDAEYTCEAVFKETGRVFDVAVNLPENAKLVCSGDPLPTGAENCNKEGTGIKHQYKVETSLPGAVMLGEDNQIDDKWIFQGWYDNKDGIDDESLEGGLGKKLEFIDAEEYGENIEIYPYFTRELELVLSTEPEINVTITLDNNDDAESVSAKANEAFENLEFNMDELKKDDDDSLSYEFKEFACEGSGVEYSCEAVYNTTGIEFTVAVNLPENAELICEGEKGVNCSEDGSGIKHQYRVETTPLPNAEISDEERGPWDFAGWYEKEDGNGEMLSAIPAEYHKGNSIYPYFTKAIKAKIGEEVLDVVIDCNDVLDDINEKVSEVARNHDPVIEPEVLNYIEIPYLRSFTGYKCEEPVGDEPYECEADYGYFGLDYEVSVNLPENAKLICTGDAAVNCNESETAIKHTYNEKTEPLPDAAIVDAEGQVDDSWIFNGWFDSEGGKGNKVEFIAEEEYGDHLHIFPYFTKKLELVLFDNPEIKVEIDLELDDDAESVKQKVDEALANMGSEAPTPTLDPSDKYDYTFKDYECKASEESYAYTCEALFDSTGRVFEVVTNMPENSKLICSEGSLGVENCNKTGTGIVHQYGVKTAPFPRAFMVGEDDNADVSWRFQGWFDNKDGIGDNVESIPAEAYGDDINIFPYFTKNMEVVLSETPDVSVNIVIDNNDDADSISAKVNKAYAELDPKPEDPTREKSDEYEYTFVGYECDANFVCVAIFDSTAFSIEVVVAYGSGALDTIRVPVKSTDTEDAIEKKVADAFKNHTPAIPIPTKDEDLMYTYEFDKFVKNSKTGKYEPRFTSKRKTFEIAFNMPSGAKLVKELEGYAIGEKTSLPDAVIENSKWEFKGWYLEPNGEGERIKTITESDMGDLTFYAFFQMTVPYEVNGKKGYVKVPYSENVEKVIETALNGVIPKNFEKNGKTYTFAKWNKVKDVYVAEFEPVGIAVARTPVFSVMAVDRTIEISGAKMGARIAVFDMQGRLVENGIVENGTQRVELSKSGSYVVRVNNQAVRVNVR